MPNRGDLDLNSIYSCTDSLKQTLKQTMLNQELAFMRQVDELHELCRIQIDMMEDSRWKRMDNYNLHKGGMKFIYENTNLAQCYVADLALSGNFNLQHEQRTHFAFMQKPLDLQLSADEFISHCVDDCLGKEPLTASLKNIVVSKNFSQGITISDIDNLKLSLSIGLDAGKKVEDHKSSEASKTCASSSEVIDLEDPYFRFPNNDACLELAPCFAATKIPSKDKHNLKSFSQIEMNHVPYGTPASKSVLDFSPSCQRQTPSYSGSIGHHIEFLCGDLLFKNKISGSKANNLDLNMVQYEETSCFSNNYSTVHNPLRTSFSGVPDKVHTKHTIASSASLTSWKKAIVIDLSESSDKHRPLDLNIDLTHSCGENNGEEWNKDDKFRIVNRDEICFIDLDSDSDEPCSSSRSNPKIESVDSSSKISNGLSCNIDLVDAVEADVNEEKEAEPHAQDQTTNEHPNCDKLLSCTGSDFINDHQSSSLKTLQSVAKCEDLNFSSLDESQKATVGPVADNIGVPDQKSSDSTESNIQCVNSKELETDKMAKTAAESLVQISSETQVSNQIGLTKCQDKDNKPQCSSDSYEKMVLRAKESDLDDFCVSSNAFVVEESENEGNRYKLKRGTRMKDFQKDVLPSLSILSRHEISEDINIMEGVIRSREYKKMRAKMGDDGDWFRPGRSKRARSGCSRRYYL